MDVEPVCSSALPESAEMADGNTKLSLGGQMPHGLRYFGLKQQRKRFTALKQQRNLYLKYAKEGQL